MKSRDFCYWLQGYFEVAKPETIGKEETEMIKRHLNLAFVHDIDPSLSDKEQEEKLNNIHGNTIGPLPDGSDVMLRC